MGNACACVKSPTVVEDTHTEREAAPGGVYTSPPSHKRKRQKQEVGATKTHESAPSDSLRADALEKSAEVRVCGRISSPE